MMPKSVDELAAVIDQSMLGLGVTRAEMQAFCTAAKQHRFGWVCVQPNMIATARRVLAGSRTRIATVVSFPLGADTPEVKAAEARDAVERGADEIDMVIDVGAARAGDAAAIEHEVAAVRAAIPGVLLKTIIEMPLLTPQEATLAALAAERGGADIVKSSTGFKPLGIRGTTPDDIRLLRSVLRPETGIKAAGGVSNWPQTAAVLDAGATRIGASAGIAILQEYQKAGV